MKVHQDPGTPFPLLSPVIPASEDGRYPFLQAIWLSLHEPVRREYIRGQRCLANYDPIAHGWKAKYVEKWLSELLMPVTILHEEAKKAFCIPTYLSLGVEIPSSLVDFDVTSLHKHRDQLASLCTSIKSLLKQLKLEHRLKNKLKAKPVPKTKLTSSTKSTNSQCGTVSSTSVTARTGDNNSTSSRPSSDSTHLEPAGVYLDSTQLDNPSFDYALADNHPTTLPIPTDTSLEEQITQKVRELQTCYTTFYQTVLSPHYDEEERVWPGIMSKFCMQVWHGVFEKMKPESLMAAHGLAGELFYALYFHGLGLSLLTRDPGAVSLVSTYLATHHGDSMRHDETSAAQHPHAMPADLDVPWCGARMRMQMVKHVSPVSVQQMPIKVFAAQHRLYQLMIASVRGDEDFLHLRMADDPWEETGGQDDTNLDDDYDMSLSEDKYAFFGGVGGLRRRLQWRSRRNNWSKGGGILVHAPSLLMENGSFVSHPNSDRQSAEGVSLTRCHPGCIVS